MGHYIDRYQASAKDPCDSLRVYAVRDAATGGEKENIEQVWTSSPIFATSSGVRVGDNLTKIKHAYPGTKRVTYITDSDRYVTLYDDRQDGIAFEFYQNKCWGIIVHPKGAAVDEEYMHIWD